MLGFALPQFGRSAHQELFRFAATAESLGADSLWVGDRLLVPVRPSIGYGGSADIPEHFRAGLDPFVTLTVAAAATSRVRLGSSALVAPWYPPVSLARQLTSIDVVSAGRLIVGLGIGWSPEEYGAIGAPFRHRGAQLDELLDVLDAIWSTNPVTHQGERWSIPPSWVDLKPAQRPRPPVYLAAFNPAGWRRIGRRADGWLPVVRLPGSVGVEALDAQRCAIAATAHDAGRDPADIAPYVRINVNEGTTVAQVGEAVHTLADNGYPDAFVDLMYVAEGTDAYLDWVERLVAR